MSFGLDAADFMEWRVNVKSQGRALLMLFLLSDVGPNDAPTRIRKGSHATIARSLLPYGEAGATLRQLSANGVNGGLKLTHFCSDRRLQSDPPFAGQYRLARRY
jgi:hypothetical protein